jgi:hypothetical protein
MVKAIFHQPLLAFKWAVLSLKMARQFYAMKRLGLLRKVN